jgi:hypothetical protein
MDEDEIGTADRFACSDDCWYPRDHPGQCAIESENQQARRMRVVQTSELWASDQASRTRLRPAITPRAQSADQTSELLEGRDDRA